ncbi:hypothetical protein KHS38_21730 [Mucilaginibacter sp. Bleaf8]|uniref:hypothetical protein n=1 Tax=Mucilaginibacter sp. Bleaf8 TaxID=2834430 RepID=UPI001BD12E06|nr:hypothetical protein [Mucilaginibacter sp. Bleaf8]MBS7567040.1 hypothetical protein [Mucilaginibacter sp. Bleaf8]
MKLREIQRQYNLIPDRPLLSRVAATPDDIIKKFQDAGMSPTEHQLNKEETEIVATALAALPPLHQQVLRQHLKSISFLDNMPNTALTSPVTKDEGINLYHITFRAGILHQTISEWATEKEHTCFSGSDSTISVSVQAGILNALTYILLHESTHVVDGSLQLLSADTIAGKLQPNAFTASFSKGVWKNINTHDCPFTDSIVIKSRFRPGGRRFLTAEAVKVYKALCQTPFVSLYSTASWHEDLAELLTIYHLTQTLKQPFRFVVSQYGKEIYSYEPMANTFIKKRLALLKRFYSKS